MAAALLSLSRMSLSADQELSQNISDGFSKTFTDSEMRAISYLEGGKLVTGQLVLVRKAPSAWVFGILGRQLKDETFEILGLNRLAI